MSQSIFQVRPQDAGKGWAIDEYDGRGAWQSTYSKNANGGPLDKQEAQRKVFQLRRKALNSAPKAGPVNKGDGGARPGNEPNPPIPGGGDPACADALESTDVRRLIKTAHQHWYGIGWPEDEVPVALLERAMELLDHGREPLQDNTGCDV